VKQSQAGKEETERMKAKMAAKTRGMKGLFQVSEFVVWPVLQIGVWALRKDKNRS
jgi:hypothetical protein